MSDRTGGGNVECVYDMAPNCLTPFGIRVTIIPVREYNKHRRLKCVYVLIII